MEAGLQIWGGSGADGGRHSRSNSNIQPEAGLQIWGGSGTDGGRHSRSNSNIQPPWETDLAAPVLNSTVSNILPPESSPSQHHNGTSNGGVYRGVSYLGSSSLPPSPLENLYRRTASFSNSRSNSTSPAHQEGASTSTVHNNLHGRGYHFSGMPGDGVRRQSLSGPLPSPEDQSPMSYRRPSLSGPLPFSSQNPYPSTFDHPGPWISGGGSSNPYLNPFSPNGSISISSNSTLSPNSLPRPPAHHANGNDSPSLASPSSAGSGYVNSSHQADISSRGPPVRQLYGYSNGAPPDPFASPSPSPGEQWAAFPGSSNSQRTNGKPMLSQRNPGKSPGDPMNGEGGGAANGGASRVSPNLTRSRSALNNAAQNGNGKGGVIPFNTRCTLNRSVTCNGADELARKYSKGRGGLGEGVLETLVAQLVFVKEKPSMLADMIFCPSKLVNGTVFNSKGPFAYARDLVERILLAQVHALTPSFRNMAQKSGEVEEASWALSPFKSPGVGKVQESFPNEGYRLLRLQTHFVEAGLETFDMLCRVRKQFPSLLTAMANDQRGGGGVVGANNAGLLRMACFGGGPGCEALAIRLFFMRLLPPQTPMQVDISDRRDRWKEVVENMSLKGIGLLNVDLFDVVMHPTGLRTYRLLVFLDSSLGRVMKSHGSAWRSHNWAEFWSTLFRNTSPGVVVIIHETITSWEEMRPKMGSNWWCSALGEQEMVHIARKM